MSQSAEYFDFHGARLIDSRLISPLVRREILSGRYEGEEIACVLQTIRPDDRVLELGAGIGALSSVIMKRKPAARWICLEANPDLAPLIRKNHRLNELVACEVLTGALTRQSAPSEHDFYVPEDFWAASLRKPEGVPFRHKKTPGLPAGGILDRYRPTYLICDIEGGEYDLFGPGLELAGVKRLCLELHAADREKLAALNGFLLEQGFRPDRPLRAAGVFFFQRGPLS